MATQEYQEPSNSQQESTGGLACDMLRMDPHFFSFTFLQVLISHVILTYHVIPCDHFCDPLSKWLYCPCDVHCSLMFHLHQFHLFIGHYCSSDYCSLWLYCSVTLIVLVTLLFSFTISTSSFWPYSLRLDFCILQYRRAIRALSPLSSPCPFLSQGYSF